MLLRIMYMRGDSIEKNKLFDSNLQFDQHDDYRVWSKTKNGKG